MNTFKKIVAWIAIVVLTTTGLFAYDLTDKEKAKGDVIANKVLLLVSKQPQNKQERLKEKIIIQLEWIYEKARKNEKIQALVWYVIEKVKSGDKAEITKVEVKEEKKDVSKIENNYFSDQFERMKKQALHIIKFDNENLDTKIKEELEKKAIIFIKRYYNYTSPYYMEIGPISLLSYSEPKYYTEGMIMRSIPKNEKIKTFLWTFWTKAEIEKTLITSVEHCKSNWIYDLMKNKIWREPYLFELYLGCYANFPFIYNDLSSGSWGAAKMAILDAAYFILPNE